MDEHALGGILARTMSPFMKLEFAEGKNMDAPRADIGQ